MRTWALRNRTRTSRYRGYVQADAHSSYNGLFAPDSAGQASPRTEVGCWAHARRKFYDARLDDRPRCTTLLGLVQELYQVEAQAKDLTPKARLALRQELSAPVVAKIKERLDLWSVELLPRNPVAQAVHYARAQWTALLRPWEDGRLSLDNNISERLLRMAAVGRSGRPGWSPTQAPHRSGHARLTHPALRIMGSLRDPSRRGQHCSRQRISLLEQCKAFPRDPRSAGAAA
jgi:hypothetical protein